MQECLIFRFLTPKRCPNKIVPYVRDQAVYAKDELKIVSLLISEAYYYGTKALIMIGSRIDIDIGRLRRIRAVRVQRHGPTYRFGTEQSSSRSKV